MGLGAQIWYYTKDFYPPIDGASPSFLRRRLSKKSLIFHHTGLGTKNRPANDPKISSSFHQTQIYNIKA
jgi:hypothetical protein